VAETETDAETVVRGRFRPRSGFGVRGEFQNRVMVPLALGMGGFAWRAWFLGQRSTDCLSGCLVRSSDVSPRNCGTADLAFGEQTTTAELQIWFGYLPIGWTGRSNDPLASAPAIRLRFCHPALVRYLPPYLKLPLSTRYSSRRRGRAAIHSPTPQWKPPGHYSSSVLTEGET